MFKTRGRLNNVKTALLLWDGFPKTLDENQYDTITVFQIKRQMLVLKVSAKKPISEVVLFQYSNSNPSLTWVAWLHSAQVYQVILLKPFSRNSNVCGGIKSIAECTVPKSA